MATYNPNAMTAAQAISQEILKIMYGTNVDEAYHIIGTPKADAPKVESHWTAEILMNILQRGHDVSLSLIDNALASLHESGLIVRYVFPPYGYELTEVGKNEAERLLGVST